MSRSILLKNGRIIDPANKRDAVLDLHILDGKIGVIGRELSITEADVINVEGKWVVPGLIDMHVHLREPGEENKETVASGARAAVNGGFTAVCCMPNTHPPLDTASSIRYIIDRASAAKFARVYPVGAITQGLRGESLTNIGGLKAAGAVALSDDGRMVMNSLVMRRAMEYACAFNIPFTLHSIDENLAQNGQMNEGALSVRMGVTGIPAHAEVVAVARDIHLAELTGAQVHIAHVSTKDAVRLICEAKARGLNISGEASPHHLILTEDAVRGYDPNFKMNPPLRTEDDRDAIRQALADGTLDAIATDHAPHTKLEKDLPFDEAPFGVTGLETAVPATYTHLVKTGILSPSRWIECLSAAPARILGLPGGSLDVGSAADVTVIDPDLEKVVNVDDMHSISKNSCFLGQTFQGWPIMTFVSGRRLK